MRFTQTQIPIMKKKSSTKPVRRSLGKGGSTDARNSVFTRRSPVTARRKRLGEGGFINLRTVLGLTLGLSGIALAIFAGKDAAVPRASEPERYMPVPGAGSHSEADGLAQLEQYWHNRLTYPTGRFDPAWVRAAAAQHDPDRCSRVSDQSEWPHFCRYIFWRRRFPIDRQWRQLDAGKQRFGLRQHLVSRDQSGRNHLCWNSGMRSRRVSLH